MSEEKDIAVDGEDSFESSENDYSAEILAAQGLIDDHEEDQPADQVDQVDQVDHEESKVEADEQVKLPEESGDTGEEKEVQEEEQNDTEKDGEEQKKEQIAPPKGHVRLEALHAEKEHRRYVQQENTGLKEQIGQLESQLEDLRSQTLAIVQTGFKKLSSEELQKLAYDDPEAIPQYLENEKKYNETLQELSQQNKQPHETEEFKREVDFAYTSLSAQIPGILEQGSEVQKSFYDAFDKAGLDDSFSPLLDPATVLVTRDGETIPLGERAISVINLVNKIGTNDPEVIREKIEKEITEKVTNELVTKLKKPSQQSKSLADINSVDREGPGVPEPTSEQKARFTEKQWDAYTAGGDWRIK